MCAQRVHQNNLEFVAIYMPMLLIAGLESPKYAAIAGGLVWLGRLAVAAGYWHKAEWRSYGQWYDNNREVSMCTTNDLTIYLFRYRLPEFYTVYLACKLGYGLLQK